MIITDQNDIDRSKRLIAASGYMDCLHIGHVEYLEKAKALGGNLIVIVNNDLQAILKKGKPFMSEKERIVIVDSLRCVDYVFLSIDTDATVCKSLAMIKPNVFTKGGDRFSLEIPEAKICLDNGIALMDGLGSKIQSSSKLIQGIN
jgi:cytidyltransferase-like protein